MGCRIQDLLEVGNGEFVIKPLLKRWTPIAIECYQRGCKCEGCQIVPKNSFHEECRIKNYVKGYLILGIRPYSRNKNGGNYGFKDSL